MATGKKQPAKKRSAKKSGYTASDITVLEGLEAVRRRPGMYIGTTGIDGLYHLIWEVFDNSRDEVMGGHGSEVEIALLPDNVVRIVDNGRGIPVDIHPKTKVSALETIMTTLHAGGKFGGEGYRVSGGLHGVGVSVVNALSKEVSASVHREGSLFRQEYHLGKPATKLQELGKTEHQGTVVTFRPDETVFSGIDFNEPVFDPERIKEHIRNQTFLVQSMHVRIIDARTIDIGTIPEDVFYTRERFPNAPTYSFFYDGGLSSFVRYHNNTQKPIHNTIFSTNREVGDTGVFIALQYVDDISQRVFAFGNTIPNPEGGTHVTGFKTALTRTLNAYAKDKGLVKDDDKFTGDDVLEGITAIISVTLPEIQFEGQTKAKLGSVEARSAVETVFNDAFKAFLEEHPSDGRAIVSKVLLALEARKAARAAKDSILRKGALDGMTLPGKLADCQSKNRDESELFIVEGESAGGTAKQGRDRRTQAVLPLKGKILNVERVRIDKVMTSEEVKSLIIALGTSVGEAFDPSKLRYGKVIIATDADVDGAHIRTLILTLFFRYFRQLIDNGNVYFAQPPLYKVKKGRESHYAFSDQERDQIIATIAKGVKKGADGQPAGLFVQRYKGLGEMNYEELQETTMKPENRMLKRVSVADAEQANRTFDMLMGSEVA
ncbi:MAG: DNA gyrase subunit B, partial [Candidatus Kaiserbacteria bacterium]|nr:DNA gyrase subunit B [Candidatus Kaiserbacteria bacterium]